VNFSVTVTPSSPLALNTFFQITIDGQAGNPLLNAGIADPSGNLLIGSNGKAGSPYVATIAVGTRLTFTDTGRNLVTLQLVRGGVMEMMRSASGSVSQLQLFGTVRGKSILSGTLRRTRGGTGRTYLPPIRGTAGVRIKLKTPPFFFRPQG
jgi:hypothetical protein